MLLSSLSNIDQGSFNIILSQQLTHDRSYICVVHPFATIGSFLGERGARSASTYVLYLVIFKKTPILCQCQSDNINLFVLSVDMSQITFGMVPVNHLVLTLSQTTNFRCFYPERVRKRQFLIC